MNSNAESLIHLEGVTKVFLHRRGGNPRARRRPSGDQERRISFDRRTVGLRQIDAALDSRPARFADRRQLLDSMTSRWRSFQLAERARIRNREIGFIFQAFNLIGDLTVYENVELPLTYRGMARRSARSACRKRSNASAWRTA